MSIKQSAMTRAHLLRLHRRFFRVPKSWALISYIRFSSSKVLTNTWLHNTSEIISNPAAIENPKRIEQNSELVRSKFEKSQTLFEELVKMINDKRYSEVLPTLSSKKAKQVALSNPHLLSLISLLLEAKLIGIAYEVFLLYNSEIQSDIKGYPSELLEMLLKVVYYYEDYSKFDILLSQYLNTSNLNEAMLKRALILYINSSSIELSKQLFYQVVSYYSQNKINLSPEILEVFLTQLIRNKANFNNVEFGYNVWIQLGLPTTFAINDLMFYALVKSGQTNKLNNFIIKVGTEDPRVLEFNEFLNKFDQISITELENEFEKLIVNHQGDKTYIYSKIISATNNISFLQGDFLTKVMEDCKYPSPLLLAIASRVAARSDVDKVSEFMETKVISQGLFNYRFLKLLCTSYIASYPDAGSRITLAYKRFLNDNFDSTLVNWLPKASTINYIKARQDYKLIKDNRRHVLKMLQRIEGLPLPFEEKLQQWSHSLSRQGLQSSDFLFNFLFTKYNKFWFRKPNQVQMVEEILLKLASEENILKVELAILRKNVEKFLDKSTSFLVKRDIRREMIANFLAKNSGKLDHKMLCEICDLYMDIKDFSGSKKMLAQARELRSMMKTNNSFHGIPFEEANYDELIFSRLQFKQAILSLNYPEIIEVILSFSKRDDIKLRRFFIRALVRDLEYLKKYKTKLQSVKEKTEAQEKETLVVEKLCIYFENFIKGLGQQYLDETEAIITKFQSKLLKYKEYCK